MDEKTNTAESKEDQAEILGVNIPEDEYWGNYPSRICGSIGGVSGGNFTKNAVADFEQKLAEKYYGKGEMK